MQWYVMVCNGSNGMLSMVCDECHGMYCTGMIRNSMYIMVMAMAMVMVMVMVMETVTGVVMGCNGVYWYVMVCI